MTEKGGETWKHDENMHQNPLQRPGRHVTSFVDEKALVSVKWSTTETFPSALLVPLKFPSTGEQTSCPCTVMAFGAVKGYGHVRPLALHLLD